MQTEIAHLIARLNQAWKIVPDVRQSIAERLEDAATPSPGTGSGSGTSRPTEAAALRIEGLRDADRAILNAVRSVGKAVDHLELECRRGLGTDRVDTSTEPRCPKMVLHVSNEQAGPRGTVLVACGRLTASKVDERGTPVGWDPDGYCVEHRAEEDEAQRRMEIEHARRLRRRVTA